MTRQYYGIEALSLTTAQKQTLVDALKLLGRNSLHPNPCYRNHWRVRLDNNAVIFEGDFDDSNWTVISIRDRLAAIFNVAANLITSSTASTAYGPVVTYTYASQQRIRMIAFGGLLATWTQSHDAVLAYLRANLAAWEQATG